MRSKKDTHTIPASTIFAAKRCWTCCGRKLEDLRAYARQHPNFLALNPKAVVMDLAQAYHTWISECFPNAIRIADRFHVHGYVIESVQEVRKSVQQTMSPRAKAILKIHRRQPA